MAAGQCHKLTALQNGFLHIDILIVIVFPLVNIVGFDSITSEILVNALSVRYTGQAFITRNDIHV